MHAKLYKKVERLTNIFYQFLDSFARRYFFSTMSRGFELFLLRARDKKRRHPAAKSNTFRLNSG